MLEIPATDKNLLKSAKNSQQFLVCASKRMPLRPTRVLLLSNSCMPSYLKNLRSGYLKPRAVVFGFKVAVK